MHRDALCECPVCGNLELERLKRDGGDYCEVCGGFFEYDDMSEKREALQAKLDELYELYENDPESEHLQWLIQENERRLKALNYREENNESSGEI